MELGDKDILLASLLGSKIMEQVPRLAVVENEMSKIPQLMSAPFLPFQNKITVEQPISFEADSWNFNKSSMQQFAPISIRRVGDNGSFYTLPYEPFISISGKNKIVKRSIAKAPNFVGTVKEHWSQDDYEITITGTLFGSREIGSFEESFPRADFEKLRDYCISPTGLEVRCDLLQLLGINHIVVEDFNFPFSKGENVQAYDIKAVSDFSAEFLLEIE